jgi:hypothetical protein
MNVAKKIPERYSIQKFEDGRFVSVGGLGSESENNSDSVEEML